MWKHVGLGAAFLVVLTAPAALHALTAAPAPRPGVAAFAVAKASSKPFDPTCSASATAAVDTRPDPAWVRASFAHDNCWAPQAPALVNGLTASREEIVAAMAAVKRYDAVAQVYQRCISDFVRVRKIQADKALTPVDAALVTIENHRITASESSRQKAKDRMKIAINAFNEFGSQCEE